MMVLEFVFIYILIIHFLADFGLQTHEQAVGKGQGNEFHNEMLFFHVGVYTLIWMISLLAIKPIFDFTYFDVVKFGVITFYTHYTTDYITSRVGKPFWSKNDFHNGFVVVGFDQILHYLQLYYTFKYVFL